MGYKFAPPAWQPDAVASPQGWRHPKTGELLAAVRLDMTLFGEAPKEPVAEEVKVDSTEEPKPKKAKKAEK